MCYFFWSFGTQNVYFRTMYDSGFNILVQNWKNSVHTWKNRNSSPISIFFYFLKWPRSNSFISDAFVILWQDGGYSLTPNPDHEFAQVGCLIQQSVQLKSSLTLEFGSLWLAEVFLPSLRLEESADVSNFARTIKIASWTERDSIERVLKKV